ncbi:MAG: VWA domain-containing protein [Treponema sp.]|nr:VWA domain-containing protein [Treponema sp.]MCL2251812.1 VWA domain-containing protein [Treponema sp.]
MPDNKFDRFINFSSISDKKKRTEIANTIYKQLQKKQSYSAVLTNENTDNFAAAIENILSNKVMQELCIKDSSLAEHITRDILDFMNKTKKQILITENPFENEQNLLENFKQINKDSYEETWETTASFIKENYKQIDVDSYNEEFIKSISLENDPKNFDIVKELFTEKWEGYLFQEKLKWELRIIDEQRKIFCEELYEKIEQLKKLQELLEPFTGELGRLWDMSKGRWQKVNFDILKEYAELLERDKPLQELAEMLGRMHQAEREYEKEIFADLIIKPDWKVEHASKAELVGIHESDDISSMLPAEAALLADENTELLFYKKFTEKKLQTFEYQAKILSWEEEEILKNCQKVKEETKGPFIICVDTSASMDGPSETVAKTLCFALLKKAVRDNRKCYLISFSTAIETLNLTDLKNNLEKLIDFLSMSFNGGTDASPAMIEALRMLDKEDYKKADIIMVSDCVMPDFDEQTKKQIIAAKENKTKFHSLEIGNSGNKKITENFDNNWVYDSNNKDCVLQLIRDINGIS